MNRVEIENWLIALTNHKTKAKLSNQTKNHILYTFRIILKEAERERIVPFNCLATVEALANSAKERGVFSKDELGKLFPEDIDWRSTVASYNI